MGRLSKKELIRELSNGAGYNLFFKPKPPCIQEITHRLLNVNETNVNSFTTYLCEILNNGRLEKSLQKIVYKIALLIGQDFPRNQTSDDGQVLDPIFLSPIATEDLFVSLDRYHWSINGLVACLCAQNQYRNPVTGIIFTPKDIYELKKKIKSLGLHVSLNSNYQENMQQAPRNLNFEMGVFSNSKCISTTSILPKGSYIDAVTLSMIM